jgi:hypothetical protein
MNKNLEEQFRTAVSEEQRAVVAGDPDCPIGVLDMILNHDVSPIVVEAAINNPSAPTNLVDIGRQRLLTLVYAFEAKKPWHDLLRSSKADVDRIEIAERTDCPVWLLEIMIKEDDSAIVVEAAMNNPNTTDALKYIANSRIRELQRPDTSTLCPIPWNHLEVQQNGDLRVCCMCIYEPFGKLEKDGQMANIKDTALDEARNLPMIKELRKSMVNGEKHSMCKQCWDHEAVGLPSKRKSMLKIYGDEGWTLSDLEGTINTKEFPLTYLDIRFGNLCNLACRSCGPSDSSLWVDDFLKLSGQETATMLYYNRKEYKITKINNKAEIITDPEDFTWYEQDKFWEEIDAHAKYIDRLYFTGGEPSINKTHFKLLEYLIEKGYSKHITLEYNSNMVAIPEKLYGWWEQFESVGVGCSIDGINEYANYIRPPSEWEVLEKNLDRMGYSGSEKVKGSISTTISIYNIFHFLDITRWLLEKKYTNIDAVPSFHMLEGPQYMNVQALPSETKELVIQEYEKFFDEMEQTHSRKRSLFFRRAFSGILTHMMSGELTDKLPQLKIASQKVDELRGQNLVQTIPWLAKILEKVG